MRPRRLWPLLLLVPATAGFFFLLLLLLDGAEPGHRDGEGISRSEQEAHEAAERRHEVEVESDPAARPDAVLAGRSAAAALRGVRGPVCVRVEGPGGDPLPDVLVCADEPSASSREDTTDARGEVRFPDLPYDGSVTLRFRVRRTSGDGTETVEALPPWGAGSAEPHVRGPELRYVADTGLRLVLRVVEAGSGRTVESAESTLSLKTHRIASRRLEPGTFLVCPPAERPIDLRVKVTPPRGWLAWDRAQGGPRISPYAKELLYVYPLRRERTAVVTVDDADGSPAAARVHSVKAAGRLLPAGSIRGDAYDRRRVMGIPHLPGELLRVAAATAVPDFTGSAVQVVPISDDAHEEIQVLVTLPQLVRVQRVPAYRPLIGLGGGAGGAFGGRSGFHLPLRTAGTVTVSIRRRDGSPAVNAQVRIGGRAVRTDARGRARLGGVMPGPQFVKVVQVGMLPTVARVVVTSGGTVHVDVREPEGGSLEVEVVDDRGRGLPFASLRVKTTSGRPPVDLQGNVQRLDPFTDHRGRRRFDTVEGGTLHVTARWGSRTKSVPVTVTRGQPQRLRIVLPRPRP